MENKKTLIVSTSLSGGGAESIAKLMVQRLKRRFCVVFEDNRRELSSISGTYVIGGNHRGLIFIVFLLNIYRLFVIQIVKCLYRPDVTVSHLEGPNFANLLSHFGGKRIIFVHNSIRGNYRENQFLDRIKKRLIRGLYCRADLVVGVSQDICDELVDDFGVKDHRVIYVRNPIDCLQLENMSSRRYGDWRDNILDGEYVINVGSLTKQKNQEVMIGIIHRMRKTGHSIKLVILGEGEERLTLEKLCSEMGLLINGTKTEQYDVDADVYFLGYQDNPYPLIRNAKLFVMTSGWEGLPVSLLEAMSLGRPVVMSNASSGIREVLGVNDDAKHGREENRCYQITPYGILVFSECASTDEELLTVWSDAVSRLLDDPSYRERCSVAARERSFSYDIDKISREWEKILHEDKITTFC